MRVAALYDVHGMSWALAAVLAELEPERPEVILFGGDLVEGPDPAGTLELARASGTCFIRGNCEREPDAWVEEHLAPEDLRWLAGLPVNAVFDDVLYCHSTPEDDRPLLTAATPDAELAAPFEGTAVIGHTHHQFDRRVGSIRVVNAGSVGMPYEDDVAAFWTLVADGEPSFRRTAFDVDAAVRELRASGWPGAEEFAAGNLLAAPSREEAVAYFEGLRA